MTLPPVKHCGWNHRHIEHAWSLNGTEWWCPGGVGERVKAWKRRIPMPCVRSDWCADDLEAVLRKGRVSDDQAN